MDLKRIGIALALVVGIYGFALGVGSLLYATGTIATGATHNDCVGYKEEIAEERGIGEDDVPQREIKERTATCLEGHKLTEREAFRSEYLFWSIWPGVIAALIFLAWPAWARTLHNQEQAELAEGAPRLEPGT
jgi:hypothetical protein